MILPLTVQYIHQQSVKDRKVPSAFVIEYLNKHLQTQGKMYQGFLLRIQLCYCKNVVNIKTIPPVTQLLMYIYLQLLYNTRRLVHCTIHNMHSVKIAALLYFYSFNRVKRRNFFYLFLVLTIYSMLAI